MTLEMTPQAMFDRVCRHMANQKRRSVVLYRELPTLARCAYRGEDGRKCNAGALVPDDMYLPVMDTTDQGSDLRTTARRFPWIERLFGPHLGFVSLLQLVHDTSIDAQQARQSLIELAAQNGLDPSSAQLVTEWTQ